MKAQIVSYLLVLFGYFKQMFPYTAAQWGSAIIVLFIGWYLPRTKNVLANSILEGVANTLRVLPGVGPLIAELLGTKPPAPPIMTTTTTVELAPPLPEIPSTETVIKESK